MTEHGLDIAPNEVIPNHLIGQVQSKLAYIDEMIRSVTISPDGASVHLRLRAPADSETQSGLEEKVNKVIKEMAKGGIEPRIEVLEDHLDRPVPYSANPISDLDASGEVKQGHAGIFSFGPKVTRLIDVFEGYFLKLAADFEAQPQRFPTLMPAEKLGRVNYFRAFPHSLTFATHLREDLEVINDFAQNATYASSGLNTKPESFSGIQVLLSPAVCYHLYFGLADQTLTSGQLSATAVGHCFRYESSNLNALERMWDFTMREIIFVGPAEFVIENRERVRKKVTEIFREMGLAYRVESANDPFFIGEFRKQTAFQNAFQLKYEIRAFLPFKQDTLAIGSYNYHQDFFGRHLSITLPDGGAAHTGCVAFGLERLAYAFLSQFGLSTRNWPAAVREAFE
jgi:seryl-tRNA synthetase